METSEILATLKKERYGQQHLQSEELKDHAIFMISCTSDVRQLLHDLLTIVVKSLFSKQQHPNLTDTGRKKLVPDNPFPGRLSDNIDWNDDLKIWKNGWTTDLLLFCLSQYPNLPADQEKSTFESQFHLLIPPILNLIDDSSIDYKTQGCRLLHMLCEEVMRCQSDILKRTGLSDVFSDALRTNFMHLPTITSEKESLKLLSELYPAFRALVNARFPVQGRHEPMDSKEGTMMALRPATQTPIATEQMKVNSTPISKNQPFTKISLDTKEKDAHQSLLDLILRHGILASYAHAADYVYITTFLLQETSLIVSMMRIYSSKYLQVLLPLLRNVLTNPFGTAHMPLLMSALECLESLMKTCWPRVREKWWAECLRAIVGCWVQICDDEIDTIPRDDKAHALSGVKRKLRETCGLLAHIVGEDLDAAKERLEQEEERLKDLFATIDITDTVS
jgi:Tti2 family